MAAANPSCAARHHGGATSSYDGRGAAPACTHDAGARCSLCDLTTRAPERDADWTQLVGTLFRASPHDGAIFALALPAVLALAADPLLSMVDTIFVGQVREGVPGSWQRSLDCSQPALHSVDGGFESVQLCRAAGIWMVDDILSDKLLRRCADSSAGWAPTRAAAYSPCCP